MNRIRRHLFCLLICVFFVGSALPFTSLAAADHQNPEWTVTKIVEETNDRIEVKPGLLPLEPNALEVCFTFPGGTKIEKVEANYDNGDGTKPDIHYVEKQENGLLQVTVYCVNKVEKPIAGQKTLFSFLISKGSSLYKDSMKVLHSKLVDDTLHAARYDANTMIYSGDNWENNSGGGDSGNEGGSGGGDSGNEGGSGGGDSGNEGGSGGGDSGNEGGSGGGDSGNEGGSGGNDSVNGGSSSGPGQDSGSDSDVEKEDPVQVVTKEVVDKKTGQITFTDTIVDKETGTKLIITTIADQDGKLMDSSGTLIPSNSMVKVSKNTVNVTCSAPEKEWLKELAATLKNRRVTKDLSIALSLPAASINRVLKEKSNTKADVNVQIPSWISEDHNLVMNGITLPKTVLNTGKQKSKDLSVKVTLENGYAYTWLFQKNAWKKAEGTFTDLNLWMEYHLISDVKGQKTGSKQGMLFHFSEVKKFPMQVRLTADIDKESGLKAGEKVYLYGYDNKTYKTKALVYDKTYTVSNGNQVIVNLSGMRDYVLTPKKAKASGSISLVSQVTVPKSMTLYTKGRVSQKTKSIKASLPDCLVSKTSFKSQVPGPAFGAVTATYKSSKPGIASVDKNGKVTAKKNGSATITTTIKLYNGQSKTFKTVVSVKSKS